MEKVSVLFFPDNLVAQVEPGSSLLRAASLAGIELKSTCGGKGTCGRCVVKIKDGQIRVRGAGNLSAKMRQAGYVLACMCEVEGNVVVEIPKDSRLDEHQVLLDRKDVLLEQDLQGSLDAYAFKPLCRKIQVSLSAPTLMENASDLDRLLAGLKSETACEDIKMGLRVLRDLSETLRQGDFKVTVTMAEFNGCGEIIQVEPGHSKSKSYGLAVDIGTTTVVVYLLDLETGVTLAKKGTYNKQARYGDDVITRMIHASEKKEGLQELHRAVLNTINQLVDSILEQTEVQKEDIHAAMVAGNTTMAHLFLGVTPKYVRLEPYIPAATEMPPIKAVELGLHMNPDAWIYIFPSPASYVGGDIVSGALAVNIAREEKLTLFIDIGTNGEIVLGNKDWLMCCACSAGPAFEGGGITFGMRAMKGAIEHIKVDPKTYEVGSSTIGNLKPIGICGSGLIDCLAEFRKAGVIDRAGKFQLDIETPRMREGEDGAEFVLAWGRETECRKDIIVTENDVKNLLRSKGAVYAGIRSMLKEVGLQEDMIEQVLIAGGFGNYLNVKDAIEIGLLPDLPKERFLFAGNTSVKGARMALLSQEAFREIRAIGKMMTYMELSAGNTFMEEFTSALFLPHTDLSLFPTVQQ